MAKLFFGGLRESGWLIPSVKSTASDQLNEYKNIRFCATQNIDGEQGGIKEVGETTGVRYIGARILANVPRRITGFSSTQ